MKTLTTSKGTFGPFQSIEEKADHWLMNGSHPYFKTVVGDAGTIGDWDGTFDHEPDLQAAELAAKREAKIKLVKEIRNHLETRGFSYMGKVIDSDSDSVRRITVASMAAMAAQAAGQLFVITWTCADNSPLVLNASQMIGMPVAMAVAGSALHEHARNLKEQIENATLANIDSIDLEGGWPV